MRPLKVAGLLLLCGGLAACGSSAASAPMAGGSGGGVATTAPAAGSAVASSFHAWCVDYSANQTVIPALFALENGLQRNPPGIPITAGNQPLAAADMETAAADAGTLAAESVAVVHFPGTAMPDLQLGADMDGVAQTLKIAATKLASGDTSGYGEVGPGALNASGSTSGLLATLAVVTAACTTFGGVVANQQPLPTTAAVAPATAASSTSQPSVTSAFNACSLLTDAEATAVTTVSYGAGYASMSQEAFVCEWGPAAGLLSLSVKLEPDAAAAKADYSARQVYWRSDGISPAHVPNADMAFLAGNVNARTGEIVVLHGTTFFELSFLNGTFPTAAQLQAAATLITGRLP
jgi:hypothetical protein